MVARESMRGANASAPTELRSETGPSVAHRRGLNVPEDLSIVGFDDTELATNVWPELTTVKQPIAAMAEAALDLLLSNGRARRGGAAAGPAEHVLKHAMIVRESSGPPHAAASRLTDTRLSDGAVRLRAARGGR